MRISIITVVYNGEKFILDCIDSVLNQTFPDIEYIIIDGKSTDKTMELINSVRSPSIKLISEKDNGVYDALNKGIKMASGAVIGFLHADDMFASNTIVAEIEALFVSQNADAVYGDLNYINQKTDKIVRKWISNPYTLKDLELGWMPPHPTLYVKKSIYSKIGGYSLEFGTAADYEFILRLLYTEKITASYLPRLMINMRTGGMSNMNLSSRIKAFLNDYKAVRKHKLPFPFFITVFKKLKKIIQYF